ncbi:MAG: hypothetical protein KTR31_03150 [Myxococcales bacterium]|nr:hypothetical protein [Myxococcales bacterium]
MSKKKPTSTDSRIPSVDNPTAAFPIGTLAGLGEPRTATPKRTEADPHPEPDLAATEVRRPLPELDPSPLGGGLEEADEYFEVDDEAPPRRGRSRVVLPVTDPPERKVHPALLALSLLGGVGLAVALVILLGLFLLVP